MEKKVIYISLYGITEIDELNRQIFIETIPFSDLLKLEKFGITSGFRKTILASAVNYKGMALTNGIVNNWDSILLENYILIFDDLERCNMNINEILGYINNFVEHDNAKVIIVANEKEITTPKININKELKYLIALNENILFPEKKNKNSINFNYNTSSNDRTSKKINIKELDKRIDSLFREDKLYRLIKEKIIGETIYYKPEIIFIIEELVNKNVTDEEVKKIILNNKDFIKERFDFYKHQNVRTLLFGLDKFESLMKNLENEINFTEYLKVFNEIFKYIIVCSIVYKSGEKFNNWEDDNEIKVIPMTDSLNVLDYIKGFEFVNVFFMEGTIVNKEKIIDIIKRENEILKAESLESSDPLYKLNNNWWCMQDAEAEKMIKNVILLLKENPKNYNPVNYSSILYYTIILFRICVSNIDIKDVIEIMKNNLKSLRIEKNLIYLDMHHFLMKNKIN